MKTKSKLSFYRGIIFGAGLKKEDETNITYFYIFIPLLYFELKIAPKGHLFINE